MSCGESGGGGGGGSYNPLWVYIDTVYPSPVVDTPSVDLSGEAYCDNCPPSEAAFGYCPSIQPPQASGVNVAWSNKSTGAAGDTWHGISGSCSCLFSYCFSSYSHKWSASVPLAIGDNIIEIKASDASGASSTNSITITRNPHAPAGVAAVAGKGQVTLSWDSVTEADSYNLYWSTSELLTKNTGTKIPDVSSGYTHSGLSDNVTYYYIVTAVANSFESSGSSVVWATPGWHTEVLAPTASTADRRNTSLAVDSGYNAHIHYANNECKHYTTVDNNGIPFQYCDTPAYYNSYVTNATGTWVSQSLAASWDVDANIALASDDTVHIGYAGPSGLTHAVYSAGTWSIEVVDTEGWCDSSLGMDSADHLHLAYYGGSALRYASDSLGSWATQTVDAAANTGCRGTGTLSLAVEANGAAHIAYAGTYPEYGLKYATGQGGVWQSSTVDSGYVVSLSISTDMNGKAHIAYADNANQLKYAHQDGAGAWTIEVVENAGSPGHPSLVVDAAGKAHISYASGFDNGQLRYATNVSGVWSISRIDSANYASVTALALDSQGKVHLSYFDSSGSLKYATNK